MSLVVPAVLPSSLRDLEEKIALFGRISSVRRIQIDVVDGRFASPASWPYLAPAELDAMVKRAYMLPELNRLAYEVDLMCFDVERAADAWLALGATRLTFHAESAIDLPRLIATSRGRYGDFISFGLALNIASDLALIETSLGGIEYIQFMGISSIGKQGQPFDSRVFEKIRVFHNRHPKIPIQVDGGISLEKARQLVALGVSNLVVGSSILRDSNPAAAIAAFENLQSPFGV